MQLLISTLRYSDDITCGQPDILLVVRIKQLLWTCSSKLISSRYFNVRLDDNNKLLC